MAMTSTQVRHPVLAGRMICMRWTSWWFALRGQVQDLLGRRCETAWCDTW